MSDPIRPDVDLTNCDREPIHVPGSIQPHGALTAFRLADGLVHHASANLEEWLGAPPGAVLGRPWHDVLGGAAEGLHAAVEEAARRRRGRLHVQGPRPGIGVVTSRDGEEIVLEVEDSGIRSADALRALYGEVVEGLTELHRLEDPSAITRRIAEQVRSLTGFDRVMVYRFDEDWHGEVVAEVRGDELESFLGLHYPATDIPAQARRLYELQWVRVIPDIRYEPVPILAHDDAGPLDLSLTRLRSVSPIHLEYLENMGVRATLTISLLRQGRLWGLIACHHYDVHPTSFEARAACELLGRAFSAQLESAERAAGHARTAAAGAVVQRALGHALDQADWESALGEHLGALREALDAGGVALVTRNGVRSEGAVPADDALRSLVEAGPLRRAGRDDEVLASSQLARDHPELLRHVPEEQRARAAGLLAVPLRYPAGGWLLVFRPEEVTEVTWGGDPQKPAVEDDGVRLSPRRSFETWTQVVEGRARRWEDWQRETGHRFRDAFGKVVALQARGMRARADRLEESNRDLDAFAHTVAHDLRAPLRGIRNLADMVLDPEVAPSDRDELIRKMAHLADRMDGLLTSLLHYSRLGRADPARVETDMDELVSSALEDISVQIEEHGAEVSVDGPLPDLPVDPGQVTRVFHNLVLNALKYTEPTETPRVEIGAEEGPRGYPVLYVRDRGVGIDPESREEVFELFRRLHPDGRYGSGAGAGLSITRRIVELHGGRIWIEETPGGGTTVKFTLTGSDEEE